MIKVNSRVKLNLPKIKQLSKAAVLALEQTAEELHQDIVQEQVVPRDTGTLQGEAFFVDKRESSSGKVGLIHSTPYARRIYYHPEYNFSKVENPNARGKWFEPWINGEYSDFCRDTYKKIYRRLAGV